MPATFTRHTVETERKDPGIGGKPPVDRRPTAEAEATRTGIRGTRGGTGRASS